jgi:hypothetical protein
MINKRIAKSDRLANLKNDRARVIYFMIYPHLDVAGRFSGDPRDIKEDCCPRLSYSLKQIAESIIDLDRAGLLELYEDEPGRAVIEYYRYEDFQDLRKDRETESEYTSPRKSAGYEKAPGGLPECSRRTPALYLSLSLSLSSSLTPLTPQKSQLPKKPKYKIQLILDDGPKRWEGIADEDKALWTKTYPKCDVVQVLTEMIAYWDSRPKTELKQDWKKTIVNRLSWLQEHAGRGNGRGNREPDPPHIGANTKQDKGPEYWARARELKAQGFEGQALVDALAGKTQEGKHETA